MSNPYKIDWNEYAALARQAVAEGCVLLKNDDKALPIRKGERVSVFGRIQFDYYKSGTGSGGAVNTRYVTNILDALKENKDISVNEELEQTYRDWLKDHPFEKGMGWAQEPWCQEEMPVTKELAEQAAAKSDIAVVIIGRTAGEDKDNSAAEGSYLLTAAEHQMLKEVCGAFKRVAVLLNVGNIIDMKWVKEYDPAAVLYVWQGGQEGGAGAADVLTGTVTPCGKLSNTIALDISDYPSTEGFGDPTRVIYKEDIYVGYRYFETFAKDCVLYPFGYGLSYTTFTRTVESFDFDGETVTEKVTVKNTGDVQGKEVVTVFVEAPQGKLGKAARSLAAFAKTETLQPGESETLTLTFPIANLASYDDSGVTGHRFCYVLESGAYNVYTGGCVRCAKLSGSFEVKEDTVTRTCVQACAPVTKFDRMVKISILVPLYNTPLQFLNEMIESVLNQTYQNWELCLADGSDDEHTEVGARCQEYAAKDKRIVYHKLVKNEGIAGNTNECYKLATGEYIGLFDHDDILHPSVLFEYVKVINEQGADYIYCDETTFKGDSIDNMITLHFKPDFSIDNLRANNYICHFSVFSRELLEGTELFRSGFDGSQDHDMILRLTSNAKCIVHVPKLMYYWRSHKGSVASDISAKPYAIAAAKGAVADHLTCCGFKNFEIKSTRAFETIFEIKYEILKEDKISILIPNKDHLDDLRRCIQSIQERSTYDNYEIIIIENNSSEQQTFDYYKTLEGNDRIKVVTYEGDFNYSRINNYGAKFAAGEYLLLLNNDTQVITMNWMENMLMYAQRPDVGAVGAKLYYGDLTIQHAGIVIGLGAHRTAGHTHYKINHDNLGYMGRLCYAQNVSAVTGACLMVRKSLYEELGGLDESFKVALNDVDFCLRLRDKGYLNVFTPFAELYHYESASRGSDIEDAAKAQRYNEEAAHFREKWKEVIDRGDPYYNPNFSLNYSDYSLKTPDEIELNNEK